jgi:hypothetical protein
MRRGFNLRLRFAVWLVVTVALVMMAVGTLFAAGEQLPRGAILSGGSTRSSNGFVMRDVIGLGVAGGDIAANGTGLCSGFGCAARTKAEPDEPDEPDLELFLPQISTKVSN